MPWDPKEAIGNELQPDEVVRWIGAPSFGATLLDQLPQLLLGLVIAGWPSIIIWNDLLERRSSTALYGIVFAGIFVIVGLQIAGRAVWNILAVWRTAYAVTDRKLLIVKDFMRRNVLTITQSAINVVERKERPDGSGSVTFRRETIEIGEGRSTTKLAFIGVPDVRHVAQEIERLREGSTFE